jgi:hypothetical protein
MPDQGPPLPAAPALRSTGRERSVLFRSPPSGPPPANKETGRRDAVLECRRQHGELMRRALRGLRCAPRDGARIRGRPGGRFAGVTARRRMDDRGLCPGGRDFFAIKGCNSKGGSGVHASERPGRAPQAIAGQNRCPSHTMTTGPIFGVC